MSASRSIAFALVLLTSCMALAQDTGKATMVVYRYRAAQLAKRRATITLDGKRICSLVNGRFYRLEVAAGKHSLTGPDERKGVEVMFEAGKVYYFRASLNVTGIFQVRNVFTISPVAPEQGEFEIKALKELDESDVAH
jgi:hypothetical protein